MNWIIYAVACVILYGIMQFFIKLASSGSNPFVSSMIFISVQFAAQIILGAYFVSKNDLDISSDNIKYGIVGGIAAAVATILFFMALKQAPLSRVLPVVNMSVVVGVFLGVVFLKEALNIRVAAGIVLAVMSIYLLTNSS